jgi:hypothetical protein
VTRAARLAAAMLLASATAPLAAQSQGDPAHLDDFAVSAPSDKSLQVEQVSQGQDKVDSAPQPHDSPVNAEQRTEPVTIDLPQLSAKGQASEQAQLSKAGVKPDESSAAVSSTAESRPGTVQHLGGTDRCDPQLGDAELARCKRTLETRAQEFHAPAPPQLSAEETLLAEQRGDEQRAPSQSAEIRLRLASRDDPDADLESNQELAALYLDRQTAPPPAPADQPAPQIDPSLTQVLQSLQIGVPPSQGGQ